MTTLILVIGLTLYITLYFTYGKRLERAVAASDDNPTPAHTMHDGIDYVAAKRPVLFGHHFASIAGAAPIIGPVVAMAWGWLPALLWVWFGNIFIGAVHDYLALMASVRYDGRSIQFVASDLISRRTGRVFYWLVFFLLILVIGAFGAVLGGMFVADPSVPAAYLFKVAAALILGVLMYRLKVNFTVATIVGVALLGLSIVFGKQIPIRLSYDAWMAIMFVYIIIAAALPVNVLLQPRDYLNSWLLYIGLLIGSVAAATAFKGFSAPALTSFAPIITGGKATPFWPAIVLIVACGSLSGFHSLVGSGTTSKQLAKESDGLTVGYGAMLTEGFLSTLAIMAVAGFGLELLAEANAALSVQNWGGEYTRTVNAIFAKPAVFFVRAYAAMVDQSALSFMNRKIVTIIAGMWVASFAMTTLDTTNRLGRYCFAEILLPLKGTSDGIYRFFTNRWVASVIPAAIGIWLAWSKKFTILWPSFGTANQLIASIALMTGTAWIARRLKANVGMALLPAYVLWLTVTGAIVWFTLAVVLPNALATNSPTEWTVLVIEFVMFALNILFIVDFMKSRHEPAMEEVAQGA